jgi:hypothetical protein
MPFFVQNHEESSVPTYPTYPAVEIVCHAPADRLNEDAWLVMQTGPLADRIIFTAIDGATTRLTPPALERYLASLPEKLTPAAYAARLVRDSLAQQIGIGMPAELRTLALEANADLGRALIKLFGALTLESLAFPDDLYQTLAHDPRLVRLGLPACVMTLAEYNPAEHALRYAHAGDTSLLVAYQDGRVSVPTAHPAANDYALMRTIHQTRDHYPDLTFRARAQQPEIRRFNRDSGLFHNYVDEFGLPQPSRAVGVLDGLPELRYFLKTGEMSLKGVAFVCAMTDGLEWPADAREVFQDDPAKAADLAAQRNAFMAEQINILGLSGYLRLLREAEASDPDHETYPRMKTHDDAAGVLLRF